MLGDSDGLVDGLTLGDSEPINNHPLLPETLVELHAYQSAPP
jgi:hypothetical protein